MDKLFVITWVDIHGNDEPMYGCSGLFKTKESALKFLEKTLEIEKSNDCIGNIGLENDILRIEYESEYFDVLEYKIEETSVKGVQYE